jgi:hypothetical protein
MPHEMVLGDDEITRGRGVIDCANNILKWWSKWWPLTRSDSHQEVDSVTLSEINSKSDLIANLVFQNQDVFSAKDEPIGHCDILPFKIEVEGPPIRQRAYRIPFSKRKLVEESVAEMLRDGIIQPSCSPYASPVTLVPKKDGTTRFCIDYRKVNAKTKKDTYPLPNIQDIFDQIGGANIFSTLDLRSGYWQLLVDEEDREKTAFICHVGLFEYRRLPFGLCNAPSVFQRTMDKVLSGLIGKTCLVYLDDIVIFSKNETEHAEHLQEVLDRLQAAGLTLKASKCSFGLTSVNLLGYQISKDGITMDPKKVEAIVKLDPPKTVSEIRSFMGMAGYYRQCLPNFAQIAEPLVRLTRKYVKFQWTMDQQKAFDTLKAMLVSGHVMAYPKLNQPYKLYTDACNHAVGGILCQVDDNGVEKVIQYISHQLSGPQLKWATIEKEAYAVVYAIRKLRPYLYGAPFTVFTDHKPLKSLFTQEMQNTKIQRWAVLLAEYGAKIEYRKGKNNIRADMLSRIKPAVQNIMEVGVIDTDEWIDPDALGDDEAYKRLPLEAHGINIDEVRDLQKQEFEDEITHAGEDDSPYEIFDGLLYSIRKPTPHAAIYPRLVLPQKFRRNVILDSHKDVGHMGLQKTLDRIRDAYVWTNMRKDIKTVLNVCGNCQIVKSRPQRAPMTDMPLATYPFQMIGIDLIGPFCVSPNGNRYVLNVIDHCTGWAESYPIPRKTVKCVLDAIANDLVPRHGVSEVLICDRGNEFKGDLPRYLKNMGCEQRLTTPYHPETNGKIERFNKTLKEMLTHLVNNDATEWEERLADALLAYRNSVSVVTGFTPFQLLYARRARLPLTKALQAPGHNEPFGNRMDAMATSLRKARVQTENSRKYNRERLQRRANAQELQVGDTVIIKAEERMTLTSRWDPQWEVSRINGPVCWIYHQQTGKTKVLNRNKVRVVDPNIAWDEVRPRPVRQSNRSSVPVVQSSVLPLLPSESESENEIDQTINAVIADARGESDARKDDAISDATDNTLPEVSMDTEQPSTSGAYIAPPSPQPTVVAETPMVVESPPIFRRPKRSRKCVEYYGYPSAKQRCLRGSENMEVACCCCYF